MPLLDTLVFASYFIFTMVVGVLMARIQFRKDDTTTGYFLAGKSLPWYVVGTSYIGSNLSTEHFIGMIGMGYLYGVAIAAWEWNGVVSFSILIWFILPFYYRRGFVTMPEFLERRYGTGSRYVFAAMTVLINISAFLAAVLFAGGLALNAIFGWDLRTAIILLALVAGIYTVYGGMVAVAWTDLLQVVIMLSSALLVLILGLDLVGGWSELPAQAPDHFEFFLPVDHEALPWPGILAVIFAVNIWYQSTNQTMVQRLLSARSEWDARMGIVLAGFIKCTTPFLIVIPGIIAFVLNPNLSDANTAYPFLAGEVLPAGLFGLFMACMIAAIMSTIDSVTNSSAAIITVDFYQRLFKGDTSGKRGVLIGRIISVILLTIATISACFIDEASQVFLLIQNLFAYIAPPAASVFLFGIFWKRATGTAALTTLLAGLPVAFIIETFIFPDIVFLYRMFLAWVTCMILMVVVSLLSKKMDSERVREFLWSPAYLTTSGVRETGRMNWLRDWRLWWGIYVVATLVLYLAFARL